jgi:hypothetical protein
MVFRLSFRKAPQHRFRLLPLTTSARSMTKPIAAPLPDGIITRALQVTFAPLWLSLTAWRTLSGAFPLIRPKPPRVCRNY